MFDAEEFDCGGDWVETALGGSCKFVETGTADASCRSKRAGSDGVWETMGPVPWSTVGGGVSAGVDVFLRRRRHQKNVPKSRRRTQAHEPTAMPPITPALSLKILIQSSVSRIQKLFPLRSRRSTMKVPGDGVYQFTEELQMT